MPNNLISKNEIVLMRRRYDEALRMQGIQCQYQFPILADSNYQGESVIDTYSEKIDTYIFFDSTPKVKTLKRFGWVVENSDDLPFLVHCSWNLAHVQKDSLFRFDGLHSELPERIFRVKEISYDLVAPDHIVCTVIPVYDETTLLGRTQKELEKTFNTSNHFMKSSTTYTGDYHSTKEDLLTQ